MIGSTKQNFSVKTVKQNSPPNGPVNKENLDYEFHNKILLNHFISLVASFTTSEEHDFEIEKASKFASNVIEETLIRECNTESLVNRYKNIENAALSIDEISANYVGQLKNQQAIKLFKDILADKVQDKNGNSIHKSLAILAKHNILKQHFSQTPINIDCNIQHEASNQAYEKLSMKYAKSIENPDTLYREGLNLYQQKENEQAIGKFLKALELFASKKSFKNLAITHSTLASCWREKNEIETAIQHAKKCLELYQAHFPQDISFGERTQQKLDQLINMRKI